MSRTLSRLFLMILALGAVPAEAQTCTAPAAFQPPTTGGSITGTTCGGDATASGYCGNLPAPGPAFVIRATFAATRTFTALSLNAAAGFDAALYVSSVADGCGTNAACVPADQIPDGDFYLIVTASPNATSGSCGAFTLSADGSLPVVLQSFTVT